MPAKNHVIAIDVDDLFGVFTYRLRPRQETDEPLLILYGDNGSGKTTVLQLLYHTLSFQDNRGHRTFLAQTRFKNFTVRFGNGASISAVRDSARKGNYNLVGVTQNQEVVNAAVVTNDEGRVEAGGIADGLIDELASKLDILPLTPYFLSDTRLLQSDAFGDEEHEEFISDDGFLVTRTVSNYERAFQRKRTSRTRTLAVEPSLFLFNQWMQRKAFSASSVGEASTSHIYSQILDRLSGEAAVVEHADEDKTQLMTAQIRAIGSRNKAFSSLGMGIQFPAEKILRTIQNLDSQRSALILEVVQPYVNSVSARMDALSQLQRTLTEFVNVVNSFYRNKRFTIDISDGVQVFDRKDNELSPSLLSSGEKQLLMLLCNLAVAVDTPSLFIIDEPEISLNVKWQRDIVDALLSIAGGSNVQFAFATHSIELLTRHRSSVWKLKDLSEDEHSTVGVMDS